MTNCPIHRGRRLNFALVGGIALSQLLLVAGCSKEAPIAEKAPPSVTVLTVERKDVPVTAVYVAQTQSSQGVNIQARVSGFLDKRVYVEGSVVKAGQVLFQMDQKPFQAQVDAQTAALFPAELTLATVRASVYSANVNIYKAMGGGWIVAADTLTTGAVPMPASDFGTGPPPLF